MCTFGKLQEFKSLLWGHEHRHNSVCRGLLLKLVQELSLPMWRRSLGGRAHPLAPSLSAALGRLTRLTSLAVDGKFGHLRVVSTLTNLQRLASAAPLSVEGWQVSSIRAGNSLQLCFGQFTSVYAVCSTGKLAVLTSCLVHLFTASFAFAAAIFHSATPVHHSPYQCFPCAPCRPYSDCRS